jgi:hypothetical protein
MGKPEGSGPLGRPGCRWENTKMDLKKCRMVGRGLHSSGPAQTSVMECCEHGNGQSVSIKCEEFLGGRTVSLSGRILSGPCD